MAEKLPEGTVTLLFTDVEKSTDLRTSRGDETAHALLQAQTNLVRAQIGEHGGHEVKTMGDGFMVAFGSARSAVGCAVGIQRRLDEGNRARPPEDRVRVRIGLNTGEVVRQDGDLFGEAVNAAARIMGKATGGQILVSETVRAVLGHGGDTELLDRGRFRMKGFPERWHLYEVLWRSKEEPAAVVAPVLAERTPYVGHEEERAELRRLMEQAIAGRGGIVLIRGEPGVGKTRLAQEVVLEARARGMGDQTGRCYEMEGAPPYIPFIEMMQNAMRADPGAFRVALGENAGEMAKILPELRRVYHDIPPPLELPPEQERMYLFNSMREFLERVSQVVPLLLVLDDLHWADDATLLLTQHVAQLQHQMRVLTIATYRDIELDVARPLARTLEWLVRQPGVHRIALKPLPEAGVKAMLQALTSQRPPEALVQAIYRETEGNPFFVEEVFQHLSEQGKLLDAEGRWRADLQVAALDVPEGVRLVISRRLERVSEECRTALTDAAVVGRDFTFDLLEKLIEGDADLLLDAIDEAERANLIVAADEGAAPAGTRPAEARFRFAHELIRQTLISGLSLPRRQRLHQRVAETMEQVYGESAEAYAADMAHHLYQAGASADAAKTARYLVLAGDQALQGAAFAEALRDFDRAYSLQPADDQSARAGLLYKRGLALQSLNRWDEALAHWREAADAYERSGNAEAAAETFESMCYQLNWGGRQAEALEIALRGLAMLGKRDSPSRSRLIGYAGVALSLAGFYSAGEVMSRRALTMAEKLGDAGVQGNQLAAIAVTRWMYMEPREGVAVGLRAAELLRQAGHLWYLVDDLFFTSISLLYMGRLEESAQIWSELTPLARRLGHTIAPESDELTMTRLLNAGDIDSYDALNRREIERVADRQGAGPPPLGSIVGIGVAHFWRGHWLEALAKFEELTEDVTAGVFHGIGPAFIMLARAYLGDRDGALAVLQHKGQEVASGSQGGSASASLLRPMIRAARNSGLGYRGLLGLMLESRSIRTRGLLPRSGRANTGGSWTVLFCAVEALAVLGEKADAAKLYPMVLEGMETGNLFRGFDMKLLDTLAGISAGCGGKWAEAEEHFRTALRRAEELPHIIEQPEARRWYAWMLLERDAPGDREKARTLLTEAAEMYRRIGMPKHVEMAEALLREAGG